MHIVIVEDIDPTVRTMMKVTDAHLKAIKEILPQASITVTNDTLPSINQDIKDAEILIVPNVNHINFAQDKTLKWVHVTFAGVDTLSQSLLDSDVLITNSSGIHPIPIAEHVFAFILMLTHKMNFTFRNQILSKKWEITPQILALSEIHEKTIAIVGMGRIGSRIAKLAKAFDMQVFGVVRNPRNQESIDKVFTTDQLLEVLPQVDYVVNCLPLTKETHHLFTLDYFKKMKKSAYFINVGRGKTVVEKDLIQALQQKIIAGAGIDVTEEEPLPSSNPLWDLENVIITPHISGLTPYYMDRAIAIFCENLKAYLQKKPLPNLIDKKRGY